MADSITFYRLPAPVVSATTGVAGGTLVNGTTYYYKVVPWRGLFTTTSSITSSSYLWHNGPASNEVTFTAGAVNKSCSFTWTNPDGNTTQWLIFRSTTSGVYPRSTLLAFVTSATYTDTGTATSDRTLNFGSDINCDLPAVNILGYYLNTTFTATVPAVGATSIAGFSGLTVDAYKDRFIYFSSGNCKFTDPTDGKQRPYARILSNTATTVYLDRAVAVAPATNDAYQLSWNPKDIYDAYTAGGWGTISASSNLNAGKNIVETTGYGHYRLNATLLLNMLADTNNMTYFGSANCTLEFGQACRFTTATTSMFHAKDDLVVMNGTPKSENIQSGYAIYGGHDMVSHDFKFRHNGAGLNPALGNDSVQPAINIESPPVRGCNRWSYSSFNGIRAITPQLGTLFDGNVFDTCGQSMEISNNKYNYVKSINARTSHLRLSAYAEYHIYNVDTVGGAYVLSAFATDTDEACIINPSKEFSDRIKANNVAWSSSPTGGRFRIQYQIGCLITNSKTGEPVEDAILEVFDNAGNPIYADAVGEPPVGREFHSKANFSTASTVRNSRGAWYPKVKVTEFLVGQYTQTRYYGFTTPAFTVTVGEKGTNAGEWGVWKLTANIPDSNVTGFVFDPVEKVQTIDPTKVHLAHTYGNHRYLQFNRQHNGSTDGLGVKTTSTDESNTTLPTGYASSDYTPSVAIYARRFYSDSDGVIPLIDFDAFSLRRDGTTSNSVFTYRTPWTVKISKTGYKTQYIELDPEGLYEKQFNISLEPLNYKVLKTVEVREGVYLAK